MTMVDEQREESTLQQAYQVKRRVTLVCAGLNLLLAGLKLVLGVIGHPNSGQTAAAMEVYKDLPLIIITPTASELSITQKGYRNFFRINANDAVQWAERALEFSIWLIGEKKA